MASSSDASDRTMDGGAVIVGNASVIYFVATAKWHYLDQDGCREDCHDGLY